MPGGPSVPSTRVIPEVGAGADGLSFFGMKPLFSVWGGIAWDSRVGPSLRLRLSRSPGYSVGEVGQASAFMILTTFALEGCPASLTGGRLGATACARVGPGFLDARGVNLTNAVSTLRPWFDVGLLLRGRLTIVGPLDFELEVGGRAPLLRDTFTVSSTQELVRAAPVLLSLAAGLSLRFR
jgi:hypothetical protein